MNGFVLALAAFVLLHLGASASGLRGAAIARMGATPYRIAFAIASITVLAWIILSFAAFRGNPFDPLNEQVWAPPDWGRGAAYALAAFAFVLIASGILTPNATRVGGEKVLARDDAARGVVRITRHPFLWGVSLWAAAHLLVNGERFALMLFGVLGVMALYGTRSIDRKTAKADPEGWARFEGATSNVPFAAIAQGRNKLVVSELVPGLVAGLVVFLLLGFFHTAIAGKPAF